ncbi:TATA box-binding protein, partial [Candidatus Bathyarchaeota archaeon]|nr:TATA box-binding protein [Candidatus Bathyarchaeota archaeon]
VFLVFSTGKLVCTGVRVAENVYKAVDKLHADLEEKEIISYS